MITQKQKEKFLFAGCESEEEHTAMLEWIQRSGIDKVYEVIMNQFEDCTKDWTDPTAIVIERNLRKVNNSDRLKKL